MAFIGQINAAVTVESGLIRILSSERDSVIAKQQMHIIKMDQKRIESFYMSQLRDSVTIILAASETHFIKLTGNNIF